jgi:hypothetical protein
MEFKRQMIYGKLPFRLMDCIRAGVSEKKFSFLSKLGAPERIIQKYSSPEDRADAFEGAFVAAGIAEKLASAMPIHYKEAVRNSFDKILGWHDFKGKDNLNGAFYFGISLLFNGIGLHEFYIQAKKYIGANLKLRISK